MNRKQLTTLIVLVLLVGGLGLFFSREQSASWKSADGALGQKLLPSLAINDVAQIVIKQPQKELILLKQDDRWQVKERWNYPANFSEIGDLLRKMWDLKVVQSVKIGPSQFGRLELLTPDKGTNAGTLVEFKDKSGKTLGSLLLGKKYVKEARGDSQFGGGDFPVGRYVMIPDSPPKVVVISDPLSDVEAKGDHWLNKDFFKVEKLRSISLTSTNATNSWKLAREKEAGELILADKKTGEELDSSKASSVGYALSSPSFNDVVSPDAKPEETGMDKPLLATLETFDEFIYTVKIGGKSGEDNYHLNVSVNATIPRERTPGKGEKPEDKEKLDKEFQEKTKKQDEKLKQEKALEKWTYLVSKWTIDPLLKERKDLLAEKKDESKKEATDSAAPPAPPGILTPSIFPETKPETKVEPK